MFPNTEKTSFDAVCEEVLKTCVNRTSENPASYISLAGNWFVQMVNENGSFQTRTGEGENQILHTVRFSNGYFQLPDTTSDTDMKFGFSHCGELYVDVDYQVYSEKGQLQHEEKLPRHLLVRIPVPLLPGLGMYTGESDSSGTYVIGGKRRFLPPIKAIAYNFPFRIYSNLNDRYKIQVRSAHIDRCNRSTSTIEFQIDPGNAKKKYHLILVKVPFSLSLIPAMMLVRFMKFDGGRFLEMLEEMVRDENTMGSYRLDLLSYVNMSAEDCLSQVSRLYGKPAATVENIISTEVFPHLKGNLNRKMEYMAMCICHLIKFRNGELKETDRDSRCFSRVACAMTTTVGLCRLSLLNFEKQAIKMIRKCVTGGHKLTISRILSHERFSKRVNSAFATGNWSKQRVGVTQSLQTNNLYTIQSQLRRVNSTCLNYEGSHVAVRLLHPSQAGYECCAETPEGQNIGLISALASTCTYSGDTLDICMRRDLSVIDFIAEKIPIHPEKGALDRFRIHGEYGMIRGYVDSLEDWIDEFHRSRRDLEIDPQLTYYVDYESRDWYLFADRGRMLRPLLVVRNLHKIGDIYRSSQPVSFFGDLFANGCLEYVCPGMEASLRVGADLRQPDLKTKTHLEISSVSIFGTIATQTVFFRHNQAPRLVYACAMIKQAITQHDMRDSGSACNHTLWYGGRPLVYTKTARIMNTDILPDVTNAVVLVLPMSSGQEDAIVFNRASVQCGMFTHSVSRTYSGEDSKQTQFTNPANRRYISGRKNGDYDAVDENGYPIPGKKVKGGDVIIGRLANVKNWSGPKSASGGKLNITGEDKSITLREHEKGFIQRVDIATTDKSSVVTVHVRDHAEVEVGDKFASRHSQKGVCGQLRNKEDMPFSIVTGMTPDIVVSPLGFPSRMTMGKLIELIVGKAVCLTGNIEIGEDNQDFFESFDAQLDYFKGLLKKHGFKSNGTEVFLNGHTGERIRGHVFSGVAAYHKLKHVVNGKISVRSTGPVQSLTRQPNEGRRLGGGMRFGEMEFQCVSAHAAGEVLRERSVTASDEFYTHICDRCGQLAEGNVKVDYSYCRRCETSEHVKYVPISYSTKLLIHELGATGIKVNVHTSQKRKRRSSVSNL
jgi:DNA-directed RNA polymerase beta subunit